MAVTRKMLKIDISGETRSEETEWTFWALCSKYVCYIICNYNIIYKIKIIRK